MTNVEQLCRVGIEDVSLRAGLASAGFVCESLSDLCSKTFYKLILNNDRSDYPFVDINGDSIRNNYTLTLSPGEKRTKIHGYLLALLAEASWVVIHDPYIVDNWETTKLFFQNLFPRKPLSIHCTTNIPGAKIKEIKAICQQWKMPSQEAIQRSFRRLHDRYLIIDGQVEIILTSGIDYLFRDEKECTINFPRTEERFDRDLLAKKLEEILIVYEEDFGHCQSETRYGHRG